MKSHANIKNVLRRSGSLGLLGLLISLVIVGILMSLVFKVYFGSTEASLKDTQSSSNQSPAGATREIIGDLNKRLKDQQNQFDNF
jgi:type II secretory pathway pseudopilin PulG